MTFNVLKFYVLSLVFYSSYAVINKLLYSANLIRSLLVLTILGCVLKIFLNFSLVGTFKQDGLAISTSSSYLFLFLAGAGIMIYKLKIKFNYFIKEILFNILNGLLSYLVSIILIPGNLFNNPSENNLFRLIIFICMYAVNSKLVGQNAVRLFENTLNSLYSKKIKIT
jgi:peptidoglycan biosynthesis protein MviN/MurJ (putative lipid II flippase)